MSRIVCAGLFLQLLWTCSSAASNNNCLPYGNAGSSHCSSSDQHRTDFRNLDSLLEDAKDREHLSDFLVNITLGMYQYIHPCAKIAEAALVLYFDGHDVPEASSTWWQEMSHVVGEQALIGRRRKREDSSLHSEIELLKNQLDSLVHNTGRDVGCVNLLINKYKHTAGIFFKRRHPQFYVPTTHSPVTTQPTTPTTTTPTTTTTTTTTTTPRPTTTTSTTTTSTTTTPTTTVIPASCTECDGLQCLLTTHIVTCPAGHDLCMTTVQDRTSGREIIRKCANRQSCDVLQNNVECADIETRVLSDGIRCDYCCMGSNCNKPPQLLPSANTLYQPGP